MSEDLGAWPAEQATVLLEALKSAGLTPQAKRTREGILVTVPDEEADAAQRQLVANMDAIARAAKREPSAPARRPRQRERARPEPDGGSGRPLTSQRFTRMGPVLGLLLIGVLIATLLPQLRLLITVATVAAIIYVIGKRAQNEQDGQDPRR